MITRKIHIDFQKGILQRNDEKKDDVVDVSKPVAKRLALLHAVAGQDD